MVAISIRDLDGEVRDKLRVRAARNGRSMEAEARQILSDAVSEPDRSPGLFDTLLDRFSELGGVELDIPRRNEAPRSADFTT